MKANGARAVLVCAYGNRHWDDTLTELQDTMEHNGFICVAAVAAVAEHSIFRQYAAGRPDALDSTELSAFARQIAIMIEAGASASLQLEGNHTVYKKYGGVPLKPEGDKKCVNCGFCAASCPVGAIDAEDPHSTDKDKCISCKRCVTLCPKHARDFSPIIMACAGVAMGPKLGGRKRNHLFL